MGPDQSWIRKYLTMTIFTMFYCGNSSSGKPVIWAIPLSWAGMVFVFSLVSSWNWPIAKYYGYRWTGSRFNCHSWEKRRKKWSTRRPLEIGRSNLSLIPNWSALWLRSRLPQSQSRRGMHVLRSLVFFFPFLLGNKQSVTVNPKNSQNKNLLILGLE